MESDDVPDTTMPEDDLAAQDVGGTPPPARSGAAGGQQRLRFENEEKDSHPLQLRCVLEILNTGMQFSAEANLVGSKWNRWAMEKLVEFMSLSNAKDP